MSNGPSLALVKHRLPPLWDGRRVVWDPFSTMGAVHICPPPPTGACDSCGSVADQLFATGLRDPLAGETFESTRTKFARGARGARTVTLTATISAYPLRDIHAFRCPDCLRTEVWDQRTDEWWELGPEDYGSSGSVAPEENR